MPKVVKDGVPAGGFKTVGQIVGTNQILVNRNQNALEVAADLLTTHTPGAPVVDDAGQYVGFISEFDFLKALDSNVDLNQVTVERIMIRERIIVTANTSIDDAVRIMEEKHLLNLPVERDGTIVYTLTRHDLLRARIGLGLDIES
ncbi:MAG TPA: CBS domain-containing protein [Nitrospira sp.]|nr:CBS domain-containing protein [Nitrospira sp.]MCC7471916.1 CBS domain-containing protein [Candidatus Nomurabacteria bacterium]MBX3336908.1 CBS domain-containing protein [Nitrospira sp.]HNA25280.1 CBS domain-containing protein [Nitrospira sp.]HNK13152.1 CBS domain-containing protein [Nitrospira sp.]